MIAFKIKVQQIRCYIFTNAHPYVQINLRDIVMDGHIIIAHVFFNKNN